MNGCQAGALTCAASSAARGPRAHASDGASDASPSDHDDAAYSITSRPSLRNPPCTLR
eukprot:NODE_6589_length_495_cov_280.222727.p6 GENE.NODE_6589_length_495_cov_280.222727~~NODE_6589_length_495_cov_280.222727.p6  ORF type:complete len:58 (+),score=4.81 NODE_6589_length_495_cov_280.222727:317-490(+)